MSQPVCRVTTHGTHQIELVLRYAIPSQSPRDRYDLDVYFFLPYHLAVDEEHYPSRQFFQHLKSYVRMLPGAISFVNLANSDCLCSPLTRIRNILAENHLARTMPVNNLLYEFRMLVNMHHEEFRGLRQLIQAMVKDDAPARDIEPRIRQVLHDHDHFLTAFRQLPLQLTDTRVPDTLRDALAWAEEAISVKTGREYHKLRLLCQIRPELAELEGELIARCRQEQAFRTERKFSTVICPENPVTGETFLYREGILKKWAQSSTYMSVARSKTTTQIGHILAGLAAAVAMLFAVAAMFLAERLFVSYSLPWALLIIVSYMFKDRIKEILRGLLLRWQPKLVADDISKLVDPRTCGKVGRSCSRARYLRPANVPDYARRLRQMAVNPFRHVLPAESVLHFHNELKLYNRDLLSSHSRLEGIGALFRVRIDPWLHQMDDPNNRIYYVSEEGAKALEANRVYHVNVVVRVSRKEDESNAQLFHSRVIINRNGILRIE